MGETAENVAQRWNVSRADQEQLAVESHRKAGAAREGGRLADEIVAIDSGTGEAVTQDGCIRPATSLEALAALAPAALAPAPAALARRFRATSIPRASPRPRSATSPR